MGNENSRPTTLYGRVSKAIPPVAPQYGLNENSEWVDKGVKAFASEGDREQFIFGLISLLTHNGSLDLSNHDIKLLFSRRRLEIPVLTNSPPTPSTSSSKPAWRALMPGTPSEPDDGTRLTASLVAIDETGVIRVKVASDGEGRDVGEAFRGFKKDVEIKLGKLLSEVPDGSLNVDGGGVRRQETRAAQRVSPVSIGSRQERGGGDAPPPAYGDVDVKKG